MLNRNEMLSFCHSKENSMNIHDSLSQIHTLAGNLTERARNDEEFRSQIETDPLGTLTAAGLPSEILGDFLQDSGLSADGDVQGYWGHL
jgi:hypothetical protein